MALGSILITGAAGQLGQALCRQLGPAARVASRAELDLAQTSTLSAAVQRLEPAAVINCAAYTQVDRAEIESELCYRINATAVGELAAACSALAVPLVQISTDFVFDGAADRSRPFTENDTPSPRGVYAKSKLAGEQAAETCRRHLIVRTCGLYGPTRTTNFVETMLRLGAERRRVRVVDDQHCTPSYVEHVARAVLFLLDAEQLGLFHVVNHGATTWHEFAAEIFRLADPDVMLERISTAEYNAPAPRPAYSVLSTERYQALGGPPLPAWQQALAEYLQARVAR